MTKLQYATVMLHTAILSHKQESTIQCAPHFHNKVAQNRVLLYLEN